MLWALSSCDYQDTLRFHFAHNVKPLTFLEWTIYCNNWLVGNKVICHFKLICPCATRLLSITGYRNVSIEAPWFWNILPLSFKTQLHRGWKIWMPYRSFRYLTLLINSYVWPCVVDVWCRLAYAIDEWTYLLLSKSPFYGKWILFYVLLFGVLFSDVGIFGENNSAESSVTPLVWHPFSAVLLMQSSFSRFSI